MRNGLRILLGVYCWQLALVPIAVSRGPAMTVGANGVTHYRYADMRVFGVRVARWVIAGSMVFVPNPDIAERAESSCDAIANAVMTCAWALNDTEDAEATDE